MSNPLSHAARVARLIRRVQKNYIGCEVIERLPSNEEVTGIIVEMDWQASYGTDGGWAILVRYSDGLLVNTVSWTSDNVLRLTGNKS